MPSFYSTEVKKATVTLRNPSPLPLQTDVVLFLGTFQIPATGVTIPASGSVAVEFTVRMSDVGVGVGKEVRIGVYLAGTTTTLLYGQGENLNVYAPSVELVGVTWA